MTVYHKRPVSIIEDFKSSYLATTPHNNFDKELWSQLQILSAQSDEAGKHGIVRFSITVPAIYANHLNTVHGGVVATLLDGLTSSVLALIADKGSWNGTEFSRNLQISFFEPVPWGEQLNAECEIVHVGRRLATVRGVITRASDGTMLASCLHDKYSPVTSKL